MTVYDISIIGAGVAGTFAALRLAEQHKNLKGIVFEFGPPPPTCIRQDPLNIKRRRRQLEGWLGCFPTGDGKLYLEDDYQKVLSKVDGRKAGPIYKWFSAVMQEFNQDNFYTSKNPSAAAIKRAKNVGFKAINHSYQQWCPDQIHKLSKELADRIESKGNVTLSFDTEVFSVSKVGNVFKVVTSNGEYTCKSVLMCVGRSGWRWINNVYKDFGILKENDFATFGIKIELPASILKDMNRSHCSFMGDSDISIGPLQWQGSIIQEDHADVTIAAFRSNENRWKTDKVFFSLKNKIKYENEGWQQAERIAKLSYLLSGDRVGRERIKLFLKKQDQLSFLPEYSWIPYALENYVEKIIPGTISKGFFHVPDIETTENLSIDVKNNLETQIEGFFVAGESFGMRGIAAAGLTGAIALEGAVKYV